MIRSVGKLWFFLYSLLKNTCKAHSFRQTDKSRRFAHIKTRKSNVKKIYEKYEKIKKKLNKRNTYSKMKIVNANFYNLSHNLGVIYRFKAEVLKYMVP